MKNIKKIVFSLILMIICLCFTACSDNETVFLAPMMNSAVAADNGSVDVVWKQKSNAESYEVYKSTSEDGEYNLVAEVSADVNVYNDEDVELYQQYYYKVKALAGEKVSDFSSVVSAYTEGLPIANSNIEFLLTFENGNEYIFPSGEGITTNSYPLTLSVIYNGKATDNYAVFYDKESVNIEDGGNGKLIISPEIAGHYTFTFVVGEEKGTFVYNAQRGEPGNVVYSWKLQDGEQDSSSVIIPKAKESVLEIKHEGEAIEDFEAASSDENICTVRKDGSKLIVTNHSPGKSKITVKYDNQSTIFQWIVKSGRAIDPYNYVNNVPVSESLSLEQAESAVTGFAAAEYSDEEIKALAEADLTLEEAAEKISTVQDAVNYLWARDYHFDYSYNPGMEYNGYGWSWNLSSEFGFENNAGCCGGTSNLINRLLKGDYDSQGYVQVPGHVYNYFCNDGIYYICDFVGGWEAPFTDADEKNSDIGVQSYLIFACETIQKYGEYQKMMNPGFDNPESPYYLGFIYLYPMDGEDILPRGDKGYFDYTPSGGAIWHVLPTRIKDTVEFAYLHEDIEFSFAEAPTPDMYPPEVNIPKD